MITICRMVVYTLTGEDAEKINRLRTDGASIAARMKIHATAARPIDYDPEQPPNMISGWPEVAQAHIGNTAREGQKFPAVVVSLPANNDFEMVNLQVFLDGNDVYWATSVHPDQSKDPKPGTWAWPARE